MPNFSTHTTDHSTYSGTQRYDMLFSGRKLAQKGKRIPERSGMSGDDQRLAAT
jgi:hypothetical protein